MECNRDEAHKAKEIAERKFTAKDVAGAKKFALKAQNLFPALEGIAQMIATIDVHVAAEELINGEKDWYGILCVNASADDEMVKKQYRRLALMLHPDKNKSIGAEAAFKLVSEAWSILSDKTRRMAYDQKRIVKFAGQKVKKSHASSNGFHHFPSHPSSNLRAQKNTARSGPPPACPTRPTTFWTSCNRCKMQYEYLRVYLNHNLLCPNCHEPFLAVETGNPTNGHNPTVHWSSSHLQQSQNINRNLYGSGKNSSSATGSTGFTPSHGANHSYKKVTKQWDAKQRTTAGNEAVHQKNVQKRMASNVTAGDASFDRKHPSSSSTERPAKRRSISDAAGLNDFTRNRSVGETSTCNENKGSSFSTVFPAEKANVPGARMISRQSNHSSRDLSSLDIRNMLIERAKHLLLGKLDEWKSAAAAKLAEKEKAKQKQKLKSAEKEKENTLLHRGAITAHKEENEVNKSSNLNRETPSEKVSSDHPYNESDKEASEPVSIDVPDPDFHDFDKDRSEKAFEPNQVWATYDDEDGMPRFYVLVQKVISLKPFKIRMSFLNSKTNSELGPMHWVGMGFAKTCGDFRVGRYELNDHINIFSHKVRWEKGARGVIRIIPQKGDIWAVYRNWSPDWNEHTPDEIIYKYDMVEVLNDYNEQGITVARLVKLAGFKTVFYRQLDPKVVERIPREEMFRFSHQVPSYLLTGTESKNVPKGCHELDPAATPLELLQVISETKEERLSETS